jgi:ubiquinone/menaquinone biosynthesis C-methylase UbiE
VTHPAAFQGVIWGSAPFEEIAAGAAASHDALVEALGPRPGERWLDVATGTGPVALRAARVGADVTGLDVSPRMLATARRLAAAERLAVRLDVGVAEELPYRDAAFDVVSSAQGVIFAVDPGAAARELARVCRPGGRLGLTCLVRAGLAERLALLVGAGGAVLSWGEPAFVRELLGRAFELEFSRGDAPLVAPSVEAAADLYARCYPPLRFFAETLRCPDCEADQRRILIDVFSRYADAGGVRAPRPYLLVRGRRLE